MIIVSSKITPRPGLSDAERQPPSRLGDSIEKHQKDFNSKLHNDRLLVIFGSPFVSVLDVVKKENIYLDDKKISTFNFFTDQKVETIRSEEAIMGCLSIINYTSKIQS